MQIDDPAAAASLWRPVFELGPYAHHFVEMFLWHWFIEGLQSADPPVFVQRWAAMIRFALESAHWKSGSPAFYHIDDMVVELLGYHFGDSMSNDARFAPLLDEHADLLAHAAEHWFIMPRVLNGFARHVTKPAYQSILCRGIEWIHGAMQKSKPEDFRHERDFEVNVIHALRCCWERHRDRVATEPKLRTAFDGVLTYFASLGSHAAMQLRDRLLDSLDAAT